MDIGCCLFTSFLWSLVTVMFVIILDLLFEILKRWIHDWCERRREKKKKSLTKIGRVIRKEIDEKTGSMTVTVECNPEVAEIICKYMEEV